MNVCKHTERKGENEGRKDMYETLVIGWELRFKELPFLLQNVFPILTVIAM